MPVTPVPLPAPAPVLSAPRGDRVRLGAPAVVCDLHSRLTRVKVAAVAAPASLSELQAVLRQARSDGAAVSVAGGRHAMGGQQLGTATVLLDTRRLCRILAFDPASGTVEAEAGIQWPRLVRELLARQRGRRDMWTIAQKQTGADRLTLGGSLSANVHGRGLTMKPIVHDVESLTLVSGEGELVRCSRRENRRLFRLAVGGYGLFGPVYALTLRLVPRQKLERVVELIDVEDLMDGFAERIGTGFRYGDFQFAIDPRSPDFLARGVFACYRPVDPARPMPQAPRQLTAESWRELLYLAHADKTRAFQRYAAHYRSTHGQLYWSDAHQMSVYLDGYHRELDRRLGASHPGTEVITELYVPRPTLARFLAAVAEDFRRHGTEPIYGTVRLIERDEESFLAWAREPWACIVFNLHVDHTPGGLAAARDAFRRLIDRALDEGGSFYLTYHRHATRSQLEACYPQLPEFLRRKRELDPDERFQSDWYRHLRALFEERS